MRCTRLDAVLACREAIELNVKPQIAVEAMMMALLRRRLRAERMTRTTRLSAMPVVIAGVDRRPHRVR